MSHYATLGVSKDATAAEIRKAYRAAALRWHPDKNQDNLEESRAKFVEVAAAYEVLSDENSRAAYDRGGEALVRRTGGRPTASPFDFARASEMFSENFGESLMNQWQPGMKITGTLVRDGKRVTLTVTHPHLCTHTHATTTHALPYITRHTHKPTQDSPGWYV